MDWSRKNEEDVIMVCQEYSKNYEKVRVPLRKYIIGLPPEKNSKKIINRISE